MRWRGGTMIDPFMQSLTGENPAGLVSEAAGFCHCEEQRAAAISCLTSVPWLVRHEVASLRSQ
jgi:hypothetical protein